MLYGSEFGETFRRAPDSAFIAEGSPVLVHTGRRIFQLVGSRLRFKPVLSEALDGLRRVLADLDDRARDWRKMTELLQ